MPFGGKYRIIDFTLSNSINSDIRKIAVLTQYKSLSLDRHLALSWENLLNPELGEYIFTIPPQQRIDDRWYERTADAVFQNMYVIERENSPYVLILSGDHIYKMDYSEMFNFHTEKNAVGTVATIHVDAASVGSITSPWTGVLNELDVKAKTLDVRGISGPQSEDVLRVEDVLGCPCVLRSRSAWIRSRLLSAGPAGHSQSGA